MSIRTLPSTVSDEGRGAARGLRGWLDRRLGLSSLVAFLRSKKVPMHHHSIWYYFGGVALFLFLIQIGSGALLLLYYKPTAETAFESVQLIITRVPFGWLIRSAHAWAANLMIVAVFIHLASVYFLKAYRPPRELHWMSGCLLLGLVLAFGFTGYLLPWNELSFFATRVGTDIVGVIPRVGPFVRTYLRGGETVGGATLTRLFGMHVVFLPLLCVGLLAIHLALVQRTGISEPLRPSSGGQRHMPFYPHFMLRELAVWLGVLGLLAILCTVLPWELGVKADPFAPAPAGIRPEWYFTFMSQTLKYLPARIGPFEGEVVGVMAFGLAALVVVAVPFIDRRAARGRPSPGFTVAGVLAILYLATLTLLAYVKPY